MSTPSDWPEGKQWEAKDVERIFGASAGEFPKSYALLAPFRAQPQLLANILNLYANPNVKNGPSGGSSDSTVGSSSSGRARANVDIDDDHLFAVLHARTDTDMVRERNVDGQLERAVGKRVDKVTAVKIGPVLVLSLIHI